MTHETDDFARWGADWRRNAEQLDLKQLMSQLASRRRRARRDKWLNGAGFALLLVIGALSLIWFGSKNPASAFVLLFAGLAFGWSLASERAMDVSVTAAPADHLRELWLRERDLATRHARGQWLFWLGLALLLLWVPWTLWSHAAIFRDEPWPLFRAALVIFALLALSWARARRSAKQAQERLGELERLLPELAEKQPDASE